MLNEDQRIDRSPDLVARVRKLRERAEKKMNRFTRLADYDVRYVQGHGPQPGPAADEAAAAESNINREAETGTSAIIADDAGGDES